MAHDPFSWQDKAVDAWARNDCHGIIEGMTGTGKTMVAIKAIGRLRREGMKVSPLIVVPSIALLDQWLTTLRREFPGEKFGRIGDNSHDNFARCESGALPSALVSTIHSAVKAVEAGLFDHCARGISRSLLIADECHRYLNEDQILFNRILRPRYDMTMGLSATIAQYEVQGLGRIVFTYSIRDAVANGTIPAFDVLNVGVRFSSAEHRDYLELSERIRDQIQQLLAAYPEIDVGGELDWQQIRVLAREGLPLATRLLGSVFKRAALAYTASAKMQLVPQMIDLLVNRAQKKMLVFFERILSTETTRDDVLLRTAERIRKAVQESSAGGQDDAAWCKVFHSEMDRNERWAVLEEFRGIGPSALLACRALDEGIDVPAVDAAILVASTQSQRQRLQRIGRTLRRGGGNKRPLIVILYVHGVADENVRIAPQDGEFSGAATVYDAEAPQALQKMREILGLAPTKPTRPAARSLAARPCEQIDADWSLLFDAARQKPAVLERTLERLARRTPLKFELEGGKVVSGHFKMLMDGMVYFDRSSALVSVRKARKAWVGK